MKKSFLLAVLCLVLTDCVVAHQTESTHNVIKMGMICSGGICRPSEIDQAVVRVVVTSKKTNNYGSGTFIYYQNGVYLLTCAHLFESESDNLTVQFRNHTRCNTQLLAIDQQYDLAVLTMSQEDVSSLGVTPVEMTAYIPLPGARVFATGYGTNGVFKVTPATVKGYVRSEGTDARDTLTAVYDRHGATVRFGDSGGGIFNQQGQFIGTLWGSDNDCLYGTQLGRILVFLKSAIDDNTPKPMEEQSTISTPPTLPVTENPISIGQQIKEKIQSEYSDIRTNNHDLTSFLLWDWLKVLFHWTTVGLPWGIVVWWSFHKRIFVTFFQKRTLEKNESEKKSDAQTKKDTQTKENQQTKLEEQKHADKK